MTYEQEAVAFAATRLPALIGAGLVLAAAARRWRPDRTAAALLAAGGALLLGFAAAEAPVFVEAVPGWADADPLAEVLLGSGVGPFGGAANFARALLAAAAACGLAAAFLRPDPARTPAAGTADV